MGHWTLGIGHWTLEIGHWSLDIGRWRLEIGHWWVVGRFPACSFADDTCNAGLVMVANFSLCDFIAAFSFLKEESNYQAGLFEP